MSLAGYAPFNGPLSFEPVRQIPAYLQHHARGPASSTTTTTTLAVAPVPVKPKTKAKAKPKKKEKLPSWAAATLVGLSIAVVLLFLLVLDALWSQRRLMITLMQIQTASLLAGRPR